MSSTIDRSAEAGVALHPTIEVEEKVYSYETANNGASPMWCHGNTCIVRVGSEVFASGLQTLAGVAPLLNVRWLLFRRSDHGDGWELIAKDERGRTREPCPLGVFPEPGARVLLSAHPTLAGPEATHGPADPQILSFDPRDVRKAPETLRPKWEEGARFSEHSYRSFAIDGARRELVLFNNTDHDRGGTLTHAEWAFRDGEGHWAASGRLTWPWGVQYEQPQPIRVCYPAVQLKGRAVYFCGVSDINEPNSAWQQYKQKVLGLNWDFDFRRLFFTWSRDITTGRFEPWVEIASREKTCGWIMPHDLWVGDGGDVHLLWTERAIDERLREKFFPGEKQSWALNYAVVREGWVVHRAAIASATEADVSNGIPDAGRFHLSASGRLLVLYHLGPAAKAEAPNENRIAEIRKDGSVGPAEKVPLEVPLKSFFTATVRAGNDPGDVLDVLGDTGGEMRYARIRM